MKNLLALKDGFINGKWHVWQGVAGVLVSDEDSKSLTNHKDVDTAINYLWLNGDKPAARALHAHAQIEAQTAKDAKK